MSVFTIREIKNHKPKGGKYSSGIIKTTEPGTRFKGEIYLFADDVFAGNTQGIFCVKRNSGASMRIAYWLTTCVWKAKVPGSISAAS